MLLNPDRDLSTPQGEIEATIDDLRVQLNTALTNQQWVDADEIQRTILVLLDHTHTWNEESRNQDSGVHDDRQLFQMVSTPW